MANEAWVEIEGRVMSEPKSGQYQNGNTKLTFNVAVLTTKKDPAPKNANFPYLSDIYSVTVGGAKADSLLKYNSIKNGCRVRVVGDMCLSEPWQSNNTGKWGVTPYINAAFVKVTQQPNIRSGGNNYQNAPAQQQVAPEPVPEVAPDVSNELPF